MQQIKRYPVRNPLLRNYIKFFWELKIDNADINHKIIPQRNINMRFNLNDTKQFVDINGEKKLLDAVNFWGLQDKNVNAGLQQKGNVHVLGICFSPEGFFPFFNIPVSEFKNHFPGTSDIGLRFMIELNERLRQLTDIHSRLDFLENELLKMLLKNNSYPESFRKIFSQIKESYNPSFINHFCSENRISIRSLERQFNKYVGIPANTYCTLNRFHLSMNQLLDNNFEKFSDLAFDNGYFDQMHFIHDFKRFTGETPGKFVQKKKSILQIGKFS